MLYLETVPPVEDAAEWFKVAGWVAESQRGFDAAWTPMLSQWVDELVRAFQSQWMNAFQVLAEVQQPEFVALLGDMAEAGALPLSNLYNGQREATVRLALQCGPVRNRLGRRDWPFPTLSVCSVCGQQHFFDLVRYWLIRDYGEAGVCAHCRYAAFAGPEDRVFSKRKASAGLEALSELARVTGIVPSQAFRRNIKTIGMPEVLRSEVLAALISTPRWELLRQQHGGAPWLLVLQEAGIVGDTWRPARGVMCLASDGHPCRSLGERSIDDWFGRNGVHHELEPHYPKHPSLNPRAGMRADWKVGDAFVEYAGMLADKDYANKMSIKRHLAQLNEIDLVVIAPEDLYRLDVILGRFLVPDPPA